MSDKGKMLDEIPLDIQQNRVQKVSFCGERPLDLNFVDVGVPGSSVGSFSALQKRASKSGRVRKWVREAPGQAYRS